MTTEPYLSSAQRRARPATNVTTVIFVTVWETLVLLIMRLANSVSVVSLAIHSAKGA
jgi:hypothetical protein